MSSDIAIDIELDIPAPRLAEVFAHARETYPEECCGLLLGPPAAEGATRAVTEARRCQNRQNELHAKDPATFTRDAHTAYNLGPDDLRMLDVSLRKGATQITRVIYHSHNDVGAYFSAEDKRAALWEGEPLYPVDYLVVDAQKDGARGARLFRWDLAASDFLLVAVYDAHGARAEAAA